MSSKAISFQKVHGVENLYRYSNGTYYARFIRNGTEYRRSLKTKDKETAKRELATLLGLRTDERAITLAQPSICARDQQAGVSVGSEFNGDLS